MTPNHLVDCVHPLVTTEEGHDCMKGEHGIKNTSNDRASYEGLLPSQRMGL
jgi:hypothetical protein